MGQSFLVSNHLQSLNSPSLYPYGNRASSSIHRVSRKPEFILTHSIPYIETKTRYIVLFNRLQKSGYVHLRYPSIEIILPQQIEINKSLYSYDRIC